MKFDSKVMTSFSHVINLIWNKCFITMEQVVLQHAFGCEVKTVCCIVFISQGLHWRYIKFALFEHVINSVKKPE